MKRRLGLPGSRFALSAFIAGLCLALALSAPAALPAQTPEQAAEALRRNAELARRRIQQSGLSPEQIRQRLQAAGYPATLLDPYMGEPAQAGVPEASEEMLKALDALGAPPVRPEGVAQVPVEAGPQQPPAPARPLARENAPLALFGLDVFQGRTTQFQPLLTGPVPPNYKTGPGDQMVLVVTGDVEFVHELQVTREGFIVIPQVGQIFVNSLTMEQLNQLLRRRLGQAYSGIRSGTTKFDVTISRLRTNQVFVIGEVTQPGAYLLASVATALNALYAAGGPTERGNFREIAVRRQGETAATLDLYDYLLHGNTQHDIMLEQGDIVYVPVLGVRASIDGTVVRPAVYELKPGETLHHLIQYAGGVTQAAALHRARVTRILPPEERRVPGVDRVVLDVGLAEVLANGGDGAPVLRPGDAVNVFPVRSEVRNVVSLEGSVWQPGSYGFRPGITAWGLIRMGQGPRPDTYLPTAHIVRLNLVDSTLSVIPFSLDTLENGAPREDPVLEEYDAVRVFPRTRFEPLHQVEVRGAVRDAGVLPRFDGMTVRDVILRAGGLIRETYTGRAFISRLQPDSTRRILPMELDVDSLMIPLNRETLEDFDIVEVYALARFTDEFPVTISGEVRDPRTERFQEGMTLRDLVVRAGGLTPTANLTVEISRLAVPDQRAGGQIAEVITVRVDSSFIVPDEAVRFYLGHPDSLAHPEDGAVGEIELKPYDHVFVRRVPDFELPRVVTVVGEVRFPGSYTLRRKDERLGELVERTGGLQPTAFAAGSRFYRAGRLVNVDLPAVLDNRRHRDNLILQPGDSLVVPEYNAVVVVEGAVNSPSSVLYRRGADLDYYIANAAGYARNADKGRVSVRYANGAAQVTSKVLFWRVSPEPGPGSTVSVPEKPEGEPFNRTEFFGTIAQIVASMVAIVAIATR